MAKIKTRLKQEPDKEVARRLKFLRENKQWTSDQTAKELASYVKINLEGDNGKATISNLENRHQNLMPEMAIAYAKVFHVSLDYLYGLSTDMRPENKPVKETLKLSDLAIDAIRTYSDNDYPYKCHLDIFNHLCESGFMTELLSAFDKFLFSAYQISPTFHETDGKLVSVDIIPIVEQDLNSAIANAVKEAQNELLNSSIPDVYKSGTIFLND